MSKAHRGKGIRDQFAHGRGNCPVCNRSSVKILYEMEADGQKFKICKICKAAIKNGNKKLPVVETVKEKEPVSAAVPEAKEVSAVKEAADTAKEPETKETAEATEESQ
jgi:transcription elongation factor Elf1